MRSAVTILAASCSETRLEKLQRAHRSAGFCPIRLQSQPRIKQGAGVSSFRVTFTSILYVQSAFGQQSRSQGGAETRAVRCNDVYRMTI